MRINLGILLSSALSLASLVAASPLLVEEAQDVTLENRSVAGYDPSWTYNNVAAAEIWIGKALQTVGTVIGHELYTNMYWLLDAKCPKNDADNVCDDWGACFPSWNRYWYAGQPMEKDGQICIRKIKGEWQNNDIRILLFEAVAGALQALTDHGTEDGSNCYEMSGNRKGCNVGDAIRVNLPQYNGKNYLHIYIWNWTNYGTWDCCHGDMRRKDYGMIDPLGGEITQAFPDWNGKTFTRDTRCILNGWQSC